MNDGTNELKALTRDLTGRDRLGQVIVGALYIERQMQRLCAQHVQDVDALMALKLTFDQWVGLSVAFGLVERLKAPLRAFATLRNKYAHQLGYDAQPADLKNLFNTFEGEDKERIQKSIAETKRKLSAKGSASFAEFGVEMQIMFIVVGLHQAMVVANRQSNAMLKT